MAEPPSAIRTKLGQPPTSSPRTLESKRQRLGSLFSSLTFGSDPASSSSSSTIISTPNRPTRLRQAPEGSQTASQPGGWLSWLSPVKSRPAEQEQGDEGCYVDTGETGETSETGKDVAPTDNLTTGQSAKHPECYLDRLPDELVLEILFRLPSSLSQICALSLVSRRFYALAQSPTIWSDLFDSTPGFQIVPALRDRIVACEHPPPGQWQADEWTRATEGSTAPPTPISPVKWTSAKSSRSDSIPVHYPTLYRSRLALSQLIHASNPAQPPERLVLPEHNDSVYCLDLCGPWLVTGCRDRSIRFWRLADLPADPDTSPAVDQTICVHSEEHAHGGSVLTVQLELDSSGRSGTLLTGSSDMTAGLWSVKFGAQVEVKRIGTLRGHEGGVLDVALGKKRIATCSKDATVRVYDRNTLDHLFTLTAHTAPVNCLALNPASGDEGEEVVSASGDGNWIVWDMITGEEVRRGGGDGRGLACVDWQGNHIITGDNGRLIKLFDAKTTELLRTFEGHTDLVRSISLDLATRTVVSGSYDWSVRMWNLDSGELIRRVQGGHGSLVFGVGVKQGRVASVSHDKSVQVLTFGAKLPYRGLFA